MISERRLHLARLTASRGSGGSVEDVARRWLAHLIERLVKR